MYIDNSEKSGLSKLPEAIDISSKLGKKGELLVASYLEDRGIEVLEQNWRCRYGEIDLIAFEPGGGRGGAFIFVEVKTRRTKIDTSIALRRPYRPSKSVDKRKKKQVISLADYYVSHHLSDVILERGMLWWKFRFDIFEVTEFEGNYQIIELRNAFELKVN